MPEPKPVMLTDAEEDWITRKISTDEPTLNVAPLLHAVEDIVTTHVAAARREALLEAIGRIESLAGDYTNGGQTLSWQGARHCVETALAEPKRDEEEGTGV